MINNQTMNLNFLAKKVILLILNRCLLNIDMKIDVKSLLLYNSYCLAHTGVNIAMTLVLNKYKKNCNSSTIFNLSKTIETHCFLPMHSLFCYQARSNDFI